MSGAITAASMTLRDASGMTAPIPITAATVQAMYADASARLSPPSIADCETIAFYLTVYRDAYAERKTRLSRQGGAAWKRHRRRNEAIRKAIGVVMKEVPGFVAAIPDGALPPGGEHRDSLLGLVEAAKRAGDWWPALDGRLKRFDPRSQWAITAGCLAGFLLSGWRRANPGRLIGKPKNADQPATTVFVAALAAIGHAVTADQVARHFARDKIAFILYDSAADLPTK